VAQAGEDDAKADHELRLLYEQSQLEFWRKEREITSDYVGQQSRWLTASLLLVNSGALFGLLGAKLPSDVLANGGFFVGGIVTAIMCGFATWAAGVAGAYATEPYIFAARLLDPDHVFEERPKANTVVRVAIFSSIVLGIASLVCFVLGAWFVAEELLKEKAKPQGSVKVEIVL
jgi:hypothetical protein